MKRTNIFVAFLSVVFLLSACSGMKNSTKGGLVGGGVGAAVGAGVGAIIGDKKGAAVGAAVGTTVGATAGVLIGKKMDKQKAELEKIEGANVETVTDVNNLQAIKVTFESGILFETGKSILSTEAKTSLTKFATSLKETSETDVAIHGHTDNTGTREVNEKLSVQRANTVIDFLVSNGVNRERLTGKGFAYDVPVADNSTAEGRKQNRRVEVFITANENMIQQAQDGTLK